MSANEERPLNANILVRESIMNRLGIRSLDCVFCGKPVEVWQMDWKMDEDFREVVHSGSCAICRRAYHDKSSSRGC